MRVKLADQLTTIDLGPDLFDEGGEAAIYALPGDKFRLAKVYPDGQAELRRAKVLAAIHCAPWDPPTSDGYRRWAWPEEALLDPASGRFVGFVMPRVIDAVPFFEIANPSVRPAHAAAYKYRLQVARSLAEVVSATHDLGHVVGDLNESNQLVNRRGEVTHIDVDSFQINTGGSVHRCLVGKPEYTPPELQGARLPDVDRSPHHDAFGLAVLIHQLLGDVHPFQGRPTSPGHTPPLHEAIRLGLWPDAPGGCADYLPSRLAVPFDSHPEPLRQLWTRCFAAGQRRPEERPTPGEWVQALDASLRRVGSPAAVGNPAAPPDQLDELAKLIGRFVWAHPRLSAAAGALLVSGVVLFNLVRPHTMAADATNPRPSGVAAPAPGGLPAPAVWESLRQEPPKFDGKSEDGGARRSGSPHLFPVQGD
jgi:DNA-binding helix-hairpin-helix protein with protein kinase domain